MAGTEEYNVDICVTCLTDKPPKLPLREELMSLGVEVIFNARGVGAKASKHESHRALKDFREKEQVKELKKRRLFPKSSKRIKQKLAERRRIEHDLKSPHAFSYAAYGHELLSESFDDDETGTGSSGCSSSGKDTASTSDCSSGLKSRRRRVVKSRSLQNYWGLIKKTSKSDSGIKQSNSMGQMKSTKSQTIAELVGNDIFQDFLAPVNEKQRHIKAPSSAASHDPSSISSNHQDPTSDVNHEVHFFASSIADQYLPDLKTLSDAEKPLPGQIDCPVQDAFLDLDSTNSVYDDKSTASSEVYLDETPADQAAPEDTKEKKASEEKEVQPAEQSTSWIESSKRAFANVAAEIYGTSATEVIISDANSVKSASDNDSRSATSSTAFIRSAKHAFDSVSEEVYRAAGMMTTGETKVGNPELEILPITIQRKGSGSRPPLSPKIDLSRDRSDRSKASSNSVVSADTTLVNSLFSKFGNAGTTSKEISEMLEANPELAFSRKQENGHTLLHTLCDRGIPTRSSEHASDLTDSLVADISNYEKLISIVLDSHPDACTILEQDGDLPVHLLARRLMQWEAGWYETIYEQAQNEKDSKGKTALVITTLYQIMSRCVQIILKPIIDHMHLCREPGSVGTILPLHIAAIFTASVPTLRGILEGYPDAATLRCDLGDLRTFIPDSSLPLELHDNLSTDFPKWEVEATHDANPEIKWSESKASAKKLEDCMRRSDLLFAYNPYIAPYRFEKSRIRRIESRIQFEVNQIVESNSASLNRATEQVWIWMCTFQEDKSKRATYVNSVKRILDPLPLKLVKHLASIDTGNNIKVIDAANPECASAIQKRLDCVTKMIIPVGGSSYTTISSLTHMSSGQPSLLKTWEDAQAARLSIKGQGHSGFLCRTIFNIKENSFPTSFIILPYRLTKGKNGKLGMDSAESVTIAMKFAECLLQLTDARSVLYFLDAKAKKHYEQSLYLNELEESDRHKQDEKIQEYENSLLELYAEGKAYLYLIDEANGVPMVPDEPSVYPLELSEADSMVKKLLPLMLVGMIMMRGDKAISVLSDVLLDDSITAVAPGWIIAAKEINAFLGSRETKEFDKSSQASSSLTSNLIKFVSKGSAKHQLNSQPRSGISEWNVELAILKTLIDTNDSELTFGGLKPLCEGGDTVLWAHSPSMSTGASPSAVIRKSQSEGGCTTDYSVVSRSMQDSLRLSSSDFRRLEFYQPQDETTKDIPESDVDSDSGRDSDSTDSNTSSEYKTHEDSKYYMLFRGLVNSNPSESSDDKEHELDDRDCRETSRTLGQDSKRVWNDISNRLDHGAEYWQDWELLQLKVELADQARRLTLLSKKVTTIKENEVRVFVKEEKLYELLHEATAATTDSSNGGFIQLRKLAIRLCDLEERILCDEIDMQHLDLGVLSLEGNIDKFEQDEIEDATDSKDSISEREHPPTGRVSQQQAHINKRRVKRTNTAPETTVDWVKYSEETGRIEL